MQPVRTPTVLLVDDDVEFLRDLGDLLESFIPGIRIQRAPDATQALAVLAGGGIDVLVADNHMPGMGGLELLEVARERYPGIPRIMVTGYAYRDTAMDALSRAGVLDFISKPPNTERTVQVIRRALIEADLNRATH